MCFVSLVSPPEKASRNRDVSSEGTRYFSHVSRVDIDRYFEEFFRSHAGQCRGEATPTYSFLPFVADALKRHFPNPKFIFSFRHPVERAYSGWLMRKQLGHEDLDFIDALKRIGIRTFFLGRRSKELAGRTQFLEENKTTQHHSNLYRSGRLCHYLEPLCGSFLQESCNIHRRTPSKSAVQYARNMRLSWGSHFSSRLKNEK